MSYKIINNGRGYKGLFISLEGPEGAGKSTQVAMLTEWLISLGLPVLATREPGDGTIGSQIRQVILHPQNIDLTAKAEAMLYGADRAQHVEMVLEPALAAGMIVICDRYVDSNLAYQGYGRGLDLNFLAEINQMATGGLTPDLTLLLYLQPEVGLARVKQREKFADDKEGLGFIDRMEQEQLAFHQRICQGYLKIAEEEPNRVQIIDADHDVTTIKEEIRQIVGGVLLKRGFILGSKIDTEIFD